MPTLLVCVALLIEAAAAQSSLCSNTCASANNSICEDGGACEFGTDCADCGARLLASCASRTPCLESQLNNGVCDEHCNVYECGFDECTNAEIEAACLARLPRSLSSRPEGTSSAELTPVAVRVDYG